jgi:Protein of unknown function (DUF2934)
MQPADGKHTKSRHQRIAEKAYLRAERRGFADGDPVADWIAAEREVDAELGRAVLDRGELAPLIERFEARVEAAQVKLKALNRRVANLKEETRARRERDLKRLETLKVKLEKRLGELREHGEHAGEHVKEQAEKIWAELGELIHEIGTRKRGAKK